MPKPPQYPRPSAEEIARCEPDETRRLAMAAGIAWVHSHRKALREAWCFTTASPHHWFETILGSVRRGVSEKDPQAIQLAADFLADPSWPCVGRSYRQYFVRHLKKHVAQIPRSVRERIVARRALWAELPHPPSETALMDKLIARFDEVPPSQTP